VKRIMLAAAVVVAFVITAGAWTGLQARPASALNPQTVRVAGPVVPLHGSASAGRVTFTFDDGPGAYTNALLTEMRKLHIRGIFFVRGDQASLYTQVIRDELAAGSRVENHSFDHPSFTGVSTGKPPLPRWKVRDELTAASRAIVAAGAPAPTLYRPPFGDISPAADAVAARLGLRIVQPFSVTHDGLMVDSRDWAGATPRQIARAVERGSDGHAGMRGGSVIAFHDGAECPPPISRPECVNSAASVIRALPLIVRWMNRHHLGVTTRVPADATGGAVPVREKS
jgi:peptidoglycan/xylan/chitin deacetylase (PgdA/CDA1 family)